MYTPEEDALSAISRIEFKELHSTDWGIESCHRATLAGLWHWAIYGENN
jgi:hypothetical protein